MSELTAEINTNNLEKALRLFPKELKYNIADGMDHISRKFLNTFRKSRLQGPPGVRSGSHGIFGYFHRASLVSQDIEGMGMEIFTDSKIARIHETGATITNPGGGKIAVPLSRRTEMFQADGRLKQKFRRPQSINSVKKISLNGKGYLAKIAKKARTITPMYILKNKVKIKPRLGFIQTWDDMQNVRIEILNKSIKDTLEKTFL